MGFHVFLSFLKSFAFEMTIQIIIASQFFLEVFHFKSSLPYPTILAKQFIHPDGISTLEFWDVSKQVAGEFCL